MKPRIGAKPLPKLADCFCNIVPNGLWATICGRLAAFGHTVSTIAFALFFSALILSPAHAIKVTDSIESIEIPNVGYAWKTVNFTNTYSNAIPVCTYNLPSSSDPPVAVRIQAITATSMQIKIQQFEDSSTVTAGTVHCVVADAGAHVLPNGTRVEAGSVLSTATSGKFSDDLWDVTVMTPVPALTGTYANPVMLAQVISYNDNRASVAHANDCVARQNDPYLTGQSDGACLSKQIGHYTGSRLDETIGYIVVDATAAGVIPGVEFSASRGADTVLGVTNVPPYNYALNQHYDSGIAFQAGEDGGDGSWAVLYGSDPFAGANLALAVDEEINGGRNHTTEPVNYWVFKATPVMTIAMAPATTTVNAAGPLNYTITVTNTGNLDLTGVQLTDIMPDGAAGTLVSLVESNSSGTANVMEIGETWTWTIAYDVTQANMDAPTDLTASASVTSTEYGSFGYPAETATAAVATIVPDPKLSVTKIADQTVNVPAGTTVTYTYTVTNSGNQTLTGIALSDVHNGTGTAPVPGNETLLTDTAPSNDSTDAATNGIWDSLAPGDSVKFTSTYVVTVADIETLQ